MISAYKRFTLVEELEHKHVKPLVNKIYPLYPGVIRGQIARHEAESNI